MDIHLTKQKREELHAAAAASADGFMVQVMSNDPRHFQIAMFCLGYFEQMRASNNIAISMEGTTSPLREDT